MNEYQEKFLSIENLKQVYEDSKRDDNVVVGSEVRMLVGEILSLRQKLWDALMMIAALPPPQAAPRNPTEEMLRAARDWSVEKFHRGIGDEAATGCWRSMYDAATAAISEAEIAEQIAQWLHDETDHPDAYPDHTWPETDRDDGRREGGFVKIVPLHAQTYFRDIATRMLKGFPALAKSSYETQQAECQ